LHRNAIDSTNVGFGFRARYCNCFVVGLFNGFSFDDYRVFPGGKPMLKIAVVIVLALNESKQI